MVKKDDKRGAPRGSQGNVPHERNDTAAALIERLGGYGLPQSCISDFLEWLQEKTIIIELGTQGYSMDTVQRHYRAELDRAKEPGKELLMGRVYRMALMDEVPPGVEPNVAYRIAADKVMALLNIQHGIIPHQSHRIGGPNGGPLTIATVQAVLNKEEIEQFANIMAKLEGAAGQL